MRLQISSSSVVVFDLDDTLYKEVDFVVSAYREIARLTVPAEANHVFQQMWGCFVEKRDTFDWLVKRYAIPYSIPELVEIYRFHTPVLEVPSESLELLTALSTNQVKLGIITDGRAQTQMNKLRALGIVDMFDKIVISESFGSEKPCEANYRVFESAFPEANLLVYIGDNPRKDFVTPNQLGWTTIGVADDGRNIHQAVDDLPRQNLPHYMVKSLSEIQVEMRHDC